MSQIVVATNVSPWLPAYKAVAAHCEEKLKTTVVLREFPLDGLRTQEINAVQQGNHPFDVIQLNEGWTGEFYDKGWVRPFKDVDSSFQLDPQVITFDSLPFWDAKKRTSAESGQIVAMPINGNVELLAYRTDIYKSLGLSVPKTWEEAIQNGRRAQEARAVKYGYVMRTQASPGGNSVGYEYAHMLYSYGGDWFVDEGSDWTPALKSPEALAATKTWLALSKLGPADPQTVGQAESIALMQGGQALQSQVVAAAAADLLNPSKSKVSDKIGFAVIPAGAKGATPVSGTWSLAIPSKLSDERAKVALDFIKCVSTAESQKLFAAKGGIPIRRDVMDDPALQAEKPYFSALADSMDTLHRYPRWPFREPMMSGVEQALSQITTGKVTVEAGLQIMQEKSEAAVKEAGFLK
ncbi:extracellular solute-binding protein [Pedococcus sp. P5_B7]